jgi:predicted transcriptional regulator
MMTTQQEFLQAAMTELGLTRDSFALRLACPKRTLDNWLSPSSSNEHRTMDETMWKFVREVLDHERLKAKMSMAKD